jgi:hypothetical protein
MNIPPSTDLNFDKNVLAYHLKKAASFPDVIGEVLISRAGSKYGEHTAEL